MPQLRRRLTQAQGPATSNRLALMLAAAQRALAQNDRRLDITLLRDAARCVHRHLGPHERQTAVLTDQTLADAEAWAGEAIGAAYALLTPVTGTDDAVEVVDVAFDGLGDLALDRRFEACVDRADQFQLGVAAFVRLDNLPAALDWTRRAETGHAAAMSNLGVLLQQRGGDGDLAHAEQWYRRAATADAARVALLSGNALARIGGNVRPP